MNTQKTTLSITLVCLLGTGGQAVTAQQTSFSQIFGPPTFIPVGVRPYEVQAINLDNDPDHLLDLVVVNRGTLASNASISVLLGDIDSPSGFSAPTTLTHISLVEPVSLVLRDVNNDFQADLLVANGSARNVVVFLHTDAGAAQPFDPISLPPIAYPASENDAVLSLAIGGFDVLVEGIDGADDIVTANYSPDNTLYSFLKGNAVPVGLPNAGNGDGTFALPVERGAGLSRLRFIRTGHLKGHTAEDAVIVSSRPGAFVRVGEGDASTGSFAFNGANSVLDVPGLTTEINEAAALGDVNNDGKIDIVVTTAGVGAPNVSSDDLDTPGTVAGTIVTLFLNTTANITESEPTPALDYGEGVSFTVGDYPYSIALGDVNKDGWLDVAVTHRNTNTVDVSILLNDQSANGGFGAPLTFTFVTGKNEPDVSPRSVILVDIDGDFDLDLVTTRKLDTGDTGTPGDVVIFENLTIANADLNGDGTVDAVNLAFPIFN